VNGQLREVGMRSWRSRLVIPVPAMFGSVARFLADFASRTSSGPSIPGLGGSR